MKKIAFFALLLALPVLFSAGTPGAGQPPGPPAGDYRRVILISWDGVRRDTLHQLLERSDPGVPCWSGGTVFPTDTGRLDGQGQPLYTCLPALAGVKPAGMPAESPAYGPFQVIASHTTNDGTTYTKPQHASMLSGYDCLQHGLTLNVSTARMPVGATIYERLMDVFDPVDPVTLKRNGFIFRTNHASDKKYIGASIYFWAKRSRALQIASGHGSEVADSPGALKYAEKALIRWKQEALDRDLPDPDFFMFLHFKSTDWAAHLGGDQSKGYHETIVRTDRRLYLLMEMLRNYGFSDTAILLTTDHGFFQNAHSRNSGRTVVNTWIAAHNVQLTTSHIPLRTSADYCAADEDPADCLANGPDIPMPPEDVVPNVYVTDVTPTILDMFGVEWRATPIVGESLYQPQAP